MLANEKNNRTQGVLLQSMSGLMDYMGLIQADAQASMLTVISPVSSPRVGVKLFYVSTGSQETAFDGYKHQ